MPIMHVLDKKDEDEFKSYIIQLDYVSEIECEYKKEEDDETIKETSKMNIRYADGGATEIESEEDSPAVFTLYDDYGEVYLQTSNYVDAEKAIIQILAVQATEEDGEDPEEEPETTSSPNIPE